MLVDSDYELLSPVSEGEHAMCRVSDSLHIRLGSRSSDDFMQWSTRVICV